ncbi:MAG TPA: glycosyltransferase [Bryobacteraceae bacterium]
MRIAYFSPLPPARSGIADYSEALVAALQPLAQMEIFTRADPAFDPARFDAVLYQLGNNDCHDFVYETALRHPGVVVMHESNLHHLITDLTIKRGDWDAYVRECEYNGGASAREFAERVRRLEVGPDYEGLPMTRRILESARGVVVHSRFMEDEIRAAGFSGPIAVIPHGAWIPAADRNGYREKLGLDPTAPLVGTFGFLKPYKRIAESLRAFRRLVRVVPDARMILVGEEHPEAPVQPMIESLGLAAHARVFGFTPMEEFVGYLSACDIVLNLRYPTVGESSGTLLRALGLGKAVLVSEIGSFLELPDDVCLKVPVGAVEEELIYEYLNLLISRPEVAGELGARAKEYVARECSWPVVAESYRRFLSGSDMPAPVAGPREPHASSEELAEYLRGWAQDEAGERYLETHHTRLVKTLEITPRGGPGDRVLEMGAYLQITPALKTRLGYGEVRGCYFGKAGQVNHRTVTSRVGETFECCVDLFDAERDRYPYPDEHYTTVLCCELIEHLFTDPMHLMSEVNRILKPGGHLVLTTPNISSLRGVAAILQGYHPGFFPAYLRPSDSEEGDARHNREYTPREIRQLLENSGFTVTLLETGEFRDAPHPEFAWVKELLQRYWLNTEPRGDGIYVVGRKIRPVGERYPGWLYS